METERNKAKYSKGMLSGILIVAFLFTGILFPSLFILFFLLSLIIVLWNVRNFVSPKEEDLQGGKRQEKEEREASESQEKKLIVDLSSKDLKKENELKKEK